METKLKIRVPHQDRNDRLPWRYQNLDLPIKRSYRWLVGLIVGSWVVIGGVYLLVKVLP